MQYYYAVYDLILKILLTMTFGSYNIRLTCEALNWRGLCWERSDLAQTMTVAESGWNGCYIDPAFIGLPKIYTVYFLFFH